MGLMENPLVCICIPCFNADKTIVETLGTLRDQTYLNIEIHVFDNASTDTTVECVKQIEDKRIQIHLADGAGGDAESNFTRCLNLGRGDYTAIFHADDLYDPRIIEKEVTLLEANKDTSAVLTFATLIDDKGRRGKTYLAPEQLNIQAGGAHVFDAVNLVKAVLESDNFLFCPSAMIRTKVCVEKIKAWRGELFRSSADLDVWLRLAAYNHIAVVNEPLLFYRVSENQWTAHYRKRRKTRADIFLVLDYWLKKDEIKQSVTKVDLRNYQKLLRHDALGCMLNAMRGGEITLAQKIWTDEHSFSVVGELFQMRTIRDVKFLMLSNTLKLMLLPVVGKVLRAMLLGPLGKVRL
jgi:glycosyltransferase involved in cell wall biosynthesis